LEREKIRQELFDRLDGERRAAAHAALARLDQLVLSAQEGMRTQATAEPPSVDRDGQFLEIALQIRKLEIRDRRDK